MRLIIGLCLFLISLAAYPRDITFYWTASPTAGVTAHKIYIEYAGGNYTTPTILGNVTQYTATGLPDSAFLWVSVTAVGPAGESVHSNELYIDPINKIYGKRKFRPR